MNKFLSSLAAFVSVVAASISTAYPQEPDYRVEFPKGDGSWSVIFSKKKTNANGSATEAPSLRSMEVTRQGDLRRDALVWSDGEKTEHWWSTAGNEVFFENRGDSAVRAIKASQRSGARYDETFFSWADKKTFSGERSLDGKKFWYFEKSARDDTKDEPEIFAAWVNPETARPYAWSDGSRMVYFEFKTLEPGFKLVPPAQFMEAIARYNAYRTPPTRVKRR